VALIEDDARRTRVSNRNAAMPWLMVAELHVKTVGLKRTRVPPGPSE
jgi:hypothetical protein